MDEEKRYDALDQALAELAAGQDAATLTEAIPDLTAELETAQWARSLADIQIPTDAANRSRSQVLARAMQLRSEVQPRGWIFPRIPRLASALILALIILLSWNGLIIASARALPGDQLYPAKLTLEKLRLGLSLNPQVHQEVEEEYQARRIDEVERLLALGRVEFVQFFGMVDERWNDYWIIEGIEVHLLPETIILGDILAGMKVEVEGATQPEGWVQASEIHLQRFSFIGIVEGISDEIWSISGQDVLITSFSLIDSDLQIGDSVQVDVTSDDFGTLTAMSITTISPREVDLLATETPETSIPTDRLKPGETEDADESDESDDKDESDESDDMDEPSEADDMDDADEVEDVEDVEEHDQEDETDETDQKDDTDKSNEADESDDADESDETREQDDDDEPDEADDPDDADDSDEAGD
jgi:hypothetical protein